MRAKYRSAFADPRLDRVSSGSGGARTVKSVNPSRPILLILTFRNHKPYSAESDFHQGIMADTDLKQQEWGRCESDSGRWRAQTERAELA